MEYAEISPTYLEVRKVRLERIARHARMRPSQVEEFERLEDWMNSGQVNEDWLRSYHHSNDEYLRLLEKVLKGAVAVGEPQAKEKLRALMAEKGTMAPAVFLTPWDLTLAYLDRYTGDFADVAAFYR